MVKQLNTIKLIKSERNIKSNEFLHYYFLKTLTLTKINVIGTAITEDIA